MIGTALILAAAATACGTTWDPVQVLPVDARGGLVGARVLSPCRVASLPTEVREHLAEDIGTNKRPMADPDQEWNSGCLKSERIPSRQFVAAASAGSRWVVHYREGGYVVVEWAIVLDLAGGKVQPVWRGTCIERRGQPGSLDDLLGKVSRECGPSRQ